MMIYIDGGWSSNGIVSWGCRFEAEQPFEHFGGKYIKTGNGLHEFFALTEAIVLAAEMGFQPQDCHFATDSQTIAYGAMQHNHMSHRTSFLTHMIKMRQHIGMDRFLKVMNFIAGGARFSWVKGHKFCVGNLRADYLAGVGRKEVSKKKTIKPEPYDAWLCKTHTRITTVKGQPVHTHWHVPFTNSYIERDGVVFEMKR